MDAKTLYLKADKVYDMHWCGKVTIPQGTPCRRATNLPDGDSYWADPWPGMNETAEGWHRNYGFLIYGKDLQTAEAAWSGLTIEDEVDERLETALLGPADMD